MFISSKNMVDDDFFSVLDAFIDIHEIYTNTVNTVCLSTKIEKSPKSAITLIDVSAYSRGEIDQLSNQLSKLRAEYEYLKLTYAICEKSIAHKKKSFNIIASVLYRFKKEVQMMIEVTLELR